jgi:hypothetical protein
MICQKLLERSILEKASNDLARRRVSAMNWSKFRISCPIAFTASIGASQRTAMTVVVPSSYQERQIQYDVSLLAWLWDYSHRGHLEVLGKTLLDVIPHYDLRKSCLDLILQVFMPILMASGVRAIACAPCLMARLIAS